MPANQSEPRQWKLNDILVEIMGNDHVYFQPPEDVKIEYPCIVYKTVTPAITRADNHVYLYTDCYELTVIQEDPYDEVIHKILDRFEYARPGAVYLGDGLYHWPITLYF